MHKDLIIREATVKDIPALAHLMCQLGYPTSVSEMEKRFEVLSLEPNYKTWIAEWEGEMAGMLGASLNFSWEQNESYVRIAALVTDNRFRKQGIAIALLEIVEQWARSCGSGALLLNCGNREERSAAHAFYPKRGFTAKSTGYVKKL